MAEGVGVTIGEKNFVIMVIKSVSERELVEVFVLEWVFHFPPDVSRLPIFYVFASPFEFTFFGPFGYQHSHPGPV
jgi:hypothetical protein